MLRNKLTLILGIIAILALTISACTAEPQDAGTNDTATQDEMVDTNTGNDGMEVNNDSANSGDSNNDGNTDDMGDAQQTEMTDDEMLALIEEKLAGHHDIDRVLNADFTYDEWGATLDRMIAYGAEINDQEKELIIQWLINR